MPVALGFVGAVISGALAGFGAAGGAAAALGTALLGTVIGAATGVGLYGLNLLFAGSGQVNMETPAGVSYTDTGLRFDPTPNFTSSQAFISLVFGKTNLSPQIAHKRLYGDNYKKGFFFLACGEAPLELESLLIDDVPITELSNYSATVDPNKSYVVWKSQGEKHTVNLDGTSTLYWGASGNEYTDDPDGDPRSIAGPLTTLYGGGDLRVYWKFTQNKCDGFGWVRVKIEDYYSPSDVRYSTIANGSWGVSGITGENSYTAGPGATGFFALALDSTVAVNGGHIDTATEVSGYYTFTDLPANTLWRVTLEYGCGNPESQHDLILFVLDRVQVFDTNITEDFSCFGTAYAVVHLVWHEPLSSTPQFSAIVKGFGREVGQDEGNPALSAYFLLTDREDPDDDQHDILMDRLAPEAVDWDSVVETALFCNSLKGGDGYRFNRAFGAAMEKETALKEMMAAGRFFIYERGGKYTFRPDQSEPVAAIIDEASEIVPGSMSLAIKSYDSPNLMRVTYYDSGLGYTVQTLPIELDSEQVLIRPDQIDLTGVTDQVQAFQLGLYALLARSLLLYTLQLNVRFETALSLFLGDIVEIQTDHQLITGKQWRLMAIPAELEGHIYTLSLVQHDPEIYTSQLDEANEDGYLVFSPWYHIPLEGSPSSWPGGTTGPCWIINLDITSKVYQTAGYTTLKVEYEYLPTNFGFAVVEYSLDIGQTWVVAGQSTSNSYTFNVPLRWGVVLVRVAAVFEGVTGQYSLVQDYVTGLGGDNAGIGIAQIGWSPIGGEQ